MEGGRDFSTDVLVQILERLTPIPRRRLRLVCRHWRDAIDDAYAGDREAQNRAAKPLFLSYINNAGHCTARAYVVDDLAGGSFREVWNSGAVPHHGGIGIIGTCNGILCLSENLNPGGAVTLINPATDSTLAVPPLPYFSRQPRYGTGIHRWHELYSFMYRHMTGHYKIVHIPCYLDRTCEFNTVQVFTLGEASWMDVPVPRSSCDIAGGLVSISSALYWVTKSTEKIMSFDLEDERVTNINSLPVPAGSGYSCRLTVLRGALGIAIRVRSPTLEKIEVSLYISMNDMNKDFTYMHLHILFALYHYYSGPL
jgi:F-box interacting protein